LETVRKLGLLGGESRRIGGRVCRDLVAAAKEKSGITSDTELIEYALAEVAPKTTSARDSSVAKAGSRKTSTLSFDLLRALRRIKPHRIVENIGKSKPNGAPRTVLIVRCGESGTLIRKAPVCAKTAEKQGFPKSPDEICDHRRVPPIRAVRPSSLADFEAFEAAGWPPAPLRLCDRDAADVGGR